MPGFPSSLTGSVARIVQRRQPVAVGRQIAVALLPCWPNDKLDIENSILIDRRSPPNELRVEESAGKGARTTRVGQLKLPCEPWVQIAWNKEGILRLAKELMKVLIWLLLCKRRTGRQPFRQADQQTARRPIRLARLARALRSWPEPELQFNIFRKSWSG